MTDGTMFVIWYYQVSMWQTAIRWLYSNTQNKWKNCHFWADHVLT